MSKRRRGLIEERRVRLRCPAEKHMRVKLYPCNTPFKILHSKESKARRPREHRNRWQLLPMSWEKCEQPCDSNRYGESQ